jgi:hypothetical protein
VKKSEVLVQDVVRAAAPGDVAVALPEGVAEAVGTNTPGLFVGL